MYKTLGINSPRAQKITRQVGVFIACDLHPYKLVESRPFIDLLHMLEPRYQLPSRPYFSKTVIPVLYREVKEQLMVELKSAESVALTTDGWSSRAVQSYVTTTAHFVTPEWTLEERVLETIHVPEAHTGATLGEKLLQTATTWKTLRQHGINAVTTDNASNMTVAVQVSGLSPHIGCFAHTINLAAKRGTDVRALSRLLGRVRKIVAYFHRSNVATEILKQKLTLLELSSANGPQKLIIDVTTRWNLQFF